MKSVKRQDKARAQASVTAAADADPTSNRSITRFMRRFIAPEKRRFALGLGVLAAESITGVLAVWPLAYLIDYLGGDKLDLLPSFSSSGQTLTIFILTSLMVLAAAFSSATDSWAEVLLATAGRNIGFNIRTGLYEHLQGMSLSFHDQLRTGDTITRVTGDVDEVEDFVIDSLSDVFGSVFTLLGTLIFIAFLSWQVALVALVVIPILALVSNQFSWRIKKAAKKEKKSQGELASIAHEVLTSMRVIQTYGRGDYETERFGEASGRAVEASLRAAKLQAWFSMVVKILEALTIAFVVWLGVWLVNKSAISLGLVVLFILQIQNMFKPTRKIIKEWNKIGRLLASAGRINELFSRKQTIVDLPGAQAVGRLTGRVEFDDVNFSYQLEAEDAAALPEGHSSERSALRDLNFVIEPGEVVAIVGHTGAGKSTIAQLVPRLYDPTDGRVMIDGADIRAFTIDSLRDNISMVHQESILFSGSVADNIAYGRAGADQAEIEAAAAGAHAHDFITELPEGYDTLLGERGVGLSGGQRQRLAIARCLMRDTPLLILDEPTTGLDARASETVLDALVNLIEGRTTIVISHDFQLISRADRLLVVDGGHIVESGSYEELLAAGGVFADLHAAQSNYESTDVSDDGSEPTSGSLTTTPHQALIENHPHLAPAFDGDYMKQAIAGSMIDSNLYLLDSVKTEKHSHEDDAGAYRFRYRCRLIDRQTQAVTEGVLLAYLFTNELQRRNFRSNAVDPLLPDPSEVIEGNLFTTAVHEFADIELLVTAFPFDVELPNLRAAVDPVRVAAFLGTATQTVIDPSIVSVGIAHYGRRRRCALRYDVGDATFYAKMRTDNDVALASDEIASLNEQLLNRRWTGLALPTVVATDEEQGLIVMSEVQGQPTLQADLINGVNNNTANEALVSQVGRVAAFLHSCELDHVGSKSIEDDIVEFASAISHLSESNGPLGQRLAVRLGRLSQLASTTRPQPFQLSHGDFTPSQFLVGARELGVVDFDTLCMAEPARDLGQFLAYSRLAIARRSTASEVQERNVVLRMSDCVISAYEHEAGIDPSGVTADHLRYRIWVHEAASLMRIILHSWQKNKTQRQDVGLALLDDILDRSAGFDVLIDVGRRLSAALDGPTTGGETTPDQPTDKGRFNAATG